MLLSSAVAVIAGRYSIEHRSVLPATSSSPELPADLFTIPVDVVEHALLLCPTPPLPVTHYFAHLTYTREMQIPAGSLITARQYTIPHVCIVSEGEITVWGDGVEPLILTAPCTFVAPAGSRRIGYAHADTTWTTVMPNPDSLTDPDAVMDLWTRIPTVHLQPPNSTDPLDPASWDRLPPILHQLLLPPPPIPTSHASQLDTRRSRLADEPEPAEPLEPVEELVEEPSVSENTAR